MKLTDHQKEIMNEVLNSLNLKKISLLSGIAGVGKTFTVKSIIDIYQKKYKTVYLTATTHKALEVVTTTAPKGVKASTIHSFLNLMPDKNNYNGGMVKNRKATNKHTDLLIIEEFSMLTADVIIHLQDWMRDNPSSQVLFVGDSSQLIMADKDIEKLRLDNVTSYLTTPMRQGAMSDIAIYSKMVSDFILGKGPEPSIPWGEEVIKYESHEDFINAWKKCKTDDKAILAFRNATVNHYNRNINKYYRHQESEYEVGNRIVLRSVVFCTNGEMIPNRRTVTIDAITDMELRNPNDKYYVVECEYGTFNINKTAVWLNQLAKPYADKMDWNNYYSVREKYVQVHHADSLTVHASQGSSFDEVFIDATDIMTAPKDTRRLAYVSVSRSRGKAHIFVGKTRKYEAFKPDINDITF